MEHPPLVDRVRAEFIEMPGLQLTLSQAARLWGLEPAACRSVIDALVKASFLRWTPRGMVVRVEAPRARPKSVPTSLSAWPCDPTTLSASSRSPLQRLTATGSRTIDGAVLSHALGGDFGFDGDTESRDACRAPLTR